MSAPVAIVHDYLLQIGGAERVVETMMRAWPEARLTVSATNEALLTPTLKNCIIDNTWMQRMPGIRRHFKKYFAVFPFAFAMHRPVDAKLVLISSSGYAKWIRWRAGATSVCYCHTPPRFFWQPESYLEFEVGSAALRAMVRPVLHLLRDSDRRQADRIGHFIANSENVRKRILEWYGRDSVVIPPPVNVSRFQVSRESDDYCLIVSRLIGYKRIDLAVRAFSGSGRRLMIVGDGPDRARLQEMAGPEVEFAGRLSDEAVETQMSRCRALIFPGEEDFGIVPLEAMAHGKPVVAFGQGGALETVVDGRTGVFFREAEPESLLRAVEAMEEISWDPDVIRKHSEGFDEPVFQLRLRTFLKGIGALE